MTLHRHQLVRLSDEGWRLVREHADDGDSGECLRHWAERRLPLVVTRQHGTDVPQVDDHVALGIAAPSQWQRRRIALSVPLKHVTAVDEFPLLDDFSREWPQMFGSGWGLRVDRLLSIGVPVHVYGSWGWQSATGLAYVHASSDVDLWSPVNDASHADEVAAAFADRTPTAGPRIDGELVFESGMAVSWREWRDWRAGRCKAFLAKTLGGAALRTSWN
jgi:phosphoribosyl-dephospho-CoA transferase